jgi:hypothetical protein
MKECWVNVYETKEGRSIGSWKNRSRKEADSTALESILCSTLNGDHYRRLYVLHIRMK